MQLICLGGIQRIEQDADGGGAWNDLLEQLELLPKDIGYEIRCLSNVPAGMSQAGHESASHGIRHEDHDDGDGCGRGLGRQSCGRTPGEDDVDITAGEFGRESGKPVGLALVKPRLEHEVLALHPAEGSQRPNQRQARGRIWQALGKHADPYLLPRLLSLGGQRRSKEDRTCASEERATVHHYWITSSARASSAGGIVRPSALAVLRLMTKSNLLGCSTGRSAGLAPLRILSTYPAARRAKSFRSVA